MHKIVKTIKYAKAIFRVKVPKDYGMCCNEERAIERIKKNIMQSGRRKL